MDQESVSGETNLNPLKGKQEFIGLCNGKSRVEGPSQTAELEAQIISLELGCLFLSISQLFYSLRYLVSHRDSQKFQAYGYSLETAGRKNISFLTTMAKGTEPSLIGLSWVTNTSLSQSL